jgi:hypothetical protein
MVAARLGRSEPMTPLEAVRALYRARWGDPARTADFRVGDFSIEVLK